MGQIEIERKKRVLAFMKEKVYRPLLFDELVSVLVVPKEDEPALREMLEELITNGEILRTKNGRFSVPEGKLLLKGVIRTTGRGFGFLIPEDSDLEDVFVPPDNMGSAMNNDEVIVRITKPGNAQKKAEGEIVKVVKRSNATIVGRYEEGKNYGFVIPDDAKLDKDIFIAKADRGGAKNGQKVVVNITTWPDSRRNAEGRVTEILGYPDEPGVDVIAVVKSFGIATEFPEDVLRQAEKIRPLVSAEVIASELARGRRDLRDKVLVTIDGADAKDLDDAVSVQKLDGSGNYLLGVHIADVSYYVKENSPIDHEALKRGTSVYFVDRVIPMLPEKLSNGVCSLNPKVDRLAFSVTMTIDKTSGKIIDHEIFESIINTKERMTYTDVHKILDEADVALRKRYAPLVERFEEMRDLRNLLLERRTRRGAIEFEFAEAQVLVDQNGVPTDIVKREMTIANSIIEEFMLAANETVAEHFFWTGLPFLYRIHEDPNEDKVKMFSQFAFNLGYKMKGKNPNASSSGAKEKTHPRTFQELLFQAKGSKEEKIISTIMLRSLQKARYSSVHDRHFGLAAEYYSHFTSPIRRYPDLQIHRLMKEYLAGAMSETREAHIARFLPEVAKQCSLNERIAEDAERTVEDKKKVEFMKKHVGEEFDAVISSVTGFGFFVELENTCEGLVHVSTLDDDYYVFEEEKYRLIGERTRKIYAIGDTVRVVLSRADTSVGKLDFDVVEQKNAPT
ncbi:MAG: ribonuclease R [Clostridia bacterium]